jgi:HD superfamily phosphodiesterase
MYFNKNQIYILKETRKFVKEYMNNLNDVSHDYKHIKLVVKYSSKIAKDEGIKNPKYLFQIRMGALLHDIGDHKYTNENQKKILWKFLNKFKKLNKIDKREIIEIASNVSLSKEDNRINKKLDIVKDADRINSLGSIGIMRYISYNIINNDEPDFNEIIENMKRRTKKIIKYLKTTSGKKMSIKHLKLIKSFIKNYRDFS